MTQSMKEKLDFYFEMMDVSKAANGLYRLNCANQAIKDEIYVSPAHDLAELVTKPYRSIRYRTVTGKEDLTSVFEFIQVSVLSDPKKNIQDYLSTQHGISVTHTDPDAERGVRALTLIRKASIGWKELAFIAGLGFYFIYDESIYPENFIGETPMSLQDMQDFIDLYRGVFHAVKD